MSSTALRCGWLATGLLSLLGGSACTDVPADADRPLPRIGETRAIVPGPGLPGEYTALRDRLGAQSNNNLDVVRHGDHVFLATRLSKDHFASSDTYLFVFSSRDEQTWQFEARFSVGADLREPRFLSFRGDLFLYFAKLGTSPLAFEPQGMLMSKRLGPSQWTMPQGLYRPDEPYIPWRAKPRRGAAWLITYRNGEHIYDFSGLPMTIELLRSEDGQSFSPLRSEQPAVLRGGGSEADFEFDDRGDLYAVVRNEAGDETGFGSKICTAAAGALSSWRCKTDPKKYDSPLVFRHRDGIYLIARRNVSDTGDFALHPSAPWSAGESALNQLDYSGRPKRCALWQIDRENLQVRHVIDVPGWGDTCFPSILTPPEEAPDDAGRGARTLVLYNYSSPLDDPENGERGWNEAQKRETRIYRTELVMP